MSPSLPKGKHENLDFQRAFWHPQAMNQKRWFSFPYHKAKKGPSWIKRREYLLGAGLIFFSLLSVFLFYQNLSLKREIAALKRAVVTLELREKELETQLDQLQKEKEELLQQALGSLRKRTSYVEKIIRQLGLSRHFGTARKQKALGGPYVPPQKEYEILIEKISTYLTKFSKVPLGKPCRGYISSYYGYRRDPFTGKRAFHSGIDIVARYGAPVRATADGVVWRVGYSRGLGRYVKIRHKHGFMTVYGHLRKYVVKRGERVKKGEIIGYVGNTGRSTGPHLHYEIRRWGRSLNPLRFIRAERRLARLNLPHRLPASQK